MGEALKWFLWGVICSGITFFVFGIVVGYATGVKDLRDLLDRERARWREGLEDEDGERLYDW